MPGPLPSEKKRRRNAPTIPTTDLAASGRKGKPPKLPAAYKLAAAGRAWWKWAWALPQALAWDVGVLYVVARRAQLEDDLVALGEGERFSLADYLDLGEEDRDAAKRLEALIRRLKSLAGGRVSLMKEMRELDNRLGLNPKAMADLRWRIVDDGEQPKAKPTRKTSNRRAHLTAVK